MTHKGYYFGLAVKLATFGLGAYGAVALIVGGGSASAAALCALIGLVGLSSAIESLSRPAGRRKEEWITGRDGITRLELPVNVLSALLDVVLFSAFAAICGLFVAVDLWLLLPIAISLIAVFVNCWEIHSEHLRAKEPDKQPEHSDLSLG